MKNEEPLEEIGPVIHDIKLKLHYFLKPLEMGCGCGLKETLGRYLYLNWNHLESPATAEEEEEAKTPCHFVSS